MGRIEHFAIYQFLCLFVWFIDLFLIFLCFICLLFFSSRASRDEMAASAGASTAFPKSDSQNSGLVGNIHGQDVEASKGGSGGLVYWAEKGVASLWVVPRPLPTLPDVPHALFCAQFLPKCWVEFNNELSSTMSWVGCLLTDSELPDTWKLREWE